MIYIGRSNAEMMKQKKKQQTSTAMRLSLPTKDVQKKSDMACASPLSLPPYSDPPSTPHLRHSPHMHTRSGHIHGSTPSSVSISANRLACCASASLETLI